MYKPKQIVKGIIAATWIPVLLTPYPWLPGENHRQFLLWKISLLTCSTIAGWSLVYQHRPERLDEAYTKLEQEKLKLQHQQQQLEDEFAARTHEQNEGVQNTLKEIETITKAEIERAQAQMDAMVEEVQKERDHWHQLYLQANAPRQPILNSDAAHRCWCVQYTLWQHGIILDMGEKQPISIPEVGTPEGIRDYYILHPRNLEHFERMVKDKSLLVPLMEYALGESGGIKYEQLGQRIKITFTPGAYTSAEREEINLAKKPTS